MEARWLARRGARGAERAVRRVFRDYPGNLAVRLWNGELLAFGAGPPEVTLWFRRPGVFRKLILSGDPLGLAEAYFAGALDVEGDLAAALGLKDHLQSLRLSLTEKMTFLLAALCVSVGRVARGERAAPAARRRCGHSKMANRKAIQFHYDVSNVFYRLWLDEQMVYSCAYFESEDDSLEQAQRNKLDHICRKLRLRQGERLLDIGCGWGALLRWAAQHYGVQAHGITLSREQYEHCQARLQEEGLQGRVTVELADYRDLRGAAAFDKVVSVGMFEHVGLKNLAQYFTIVQRLLKPGGLFLNHGITQEGEGWGRSVGTRFINRYVFPDGELDTVGNAQRAMERAGLEILDVEALRPHYARTLRQWVQRLEAREAEALQHVPTSIYRVWRLYMTACALQFDRGEIGVYQILAACRDGAPAQLPRTRRDLYQKG